MENRKCIKRAPDIIFIKKRSYYIESVFTWIYEYYMVIYHWILTLGAKKNN